MPTQTVHKQFLSDATSKAQFRQQLIVAAVAGAASATNSSGVATYSAASAATFAVAIADAVFTALAAE